MNRKYLDPLLIVISNKSYDYKFSDKECYEYVTNAKMLQVSRARLTTTQKTLSSSSSEYFFSKPVVFFYLGIKVRFHIFIVRIALWSLDYWRFVSMHNTNHKFVFSSY